MPAATSFIQALIIPNSYILLLLEQWWLKSIVDSGEAFLFLRTIQLGIFH